MGKTIDNGKVIIDNGKNNCQLSSINSPLNKLVPELRFEGFDYDWVRKSLIELDSKVSDGIHSTPKYNNDGEYYFINGNNFINGLIVINPATKKVNNEEFIKHKKPLSQDTILMSINGTIGNLAFYNGEKVVLGKSACFININQESTDKVYFYYLLQSPQVKKKYFSELTGTTIKNLSLGTIKKSKYSLPKNIKEQQKIANFLTSVDQRISLLKQKKAALEQYKKGLMQKIFSQEIRFKPDSKSLLSRGDSGVCSAQDSENYADWEEKRLGEIGEIVSGLTYSPKDINENGILVLRSSNIKNNLLEFKDNVYVNVDKFNPVRLNDILICVRNGSKRLIGKNALIDRNTEGVAFGAFMSVFRSRSNRFLIHWFKSRDYKWNVHRNLGATINSINGSDLKKIKLLLPSDEEQLKIAELLSSVEKPIKKLKKQIEQTTQFKKGLLQRMFV